jgi:hypothetical protein
MFSQEGFGMTIWLEHWHSENGTDRPQNINKSLFVLKQTYLYTFYPLQQTTTKCYENLWFQFPQQPGWEVCTLKHL